VVASLRRMPAGPRRGGRRRSWRDVAFAALDFETTGLDESDAIVSYGVVPVLGGRAVLADGAHRLIRPDVAPSPRSQSVHLLRPQDLEAAPPLADARDELASMLRRRYVLAEVEVGFLARAFGTTTRAWSRRTIDVRNLAIAADGKPERLRYEHGYSLAGIARRHGVPVASPHEAYDDALVTAQLFLVLVSKLALDREPTVRDLLEIGGA
jgi:DNA polymerase III subunit epsilon